ncbi:Alpha/Beta hydrolase protein [Terfezia claveryi]|nr:Alpha/Beta hydrolase protein [Terfezia claveryi]
MTITNVLYHPTLKSKLTGRVLRDGKVIQYCGIKFGNIPARFARSTHVDNYPPELDCTKYGPVAPQVPAPQAPGAIWALPPEFQKNPEFVIDEFECLNLIVSVPKGAKEGDSLPVLVFIHGGSNKVGSANIPLYDMSLLCAHSVEKSKPVIMVAINYRVSIFGFGVLSDGTGANNGLYDQRLALQWIQKHIRGIGGDPTRVTLLGESAGAFGTDAHLHAKWSDERPELQLFRRAILFSGSLMSSRPRPAAVLNKVTRMYGAELDGEGDPEEELKRADWKEIVGVLDKMREGVWVYTEDGEFLEKPFKPYTFVPKWCDGIMIGHFFDLCGAGPWYPPTALVSAFQSLGAAGEKIIKAYDISGHNVHGGALRFISDGFFIFPTERTIDHWRLKPGKHVHQYLMDQRNPWKPEAHGAHHAIDLLYIFGILGFAYNNEGAVKVGTAFQNDVLNFVTAGKEGLDQELGWDEKNIKAYGRPDGFVGVIPSEQLGERRRVDIMRTVLTELGDEVVANAVGTVLRLADIASDLGPTAARVGGYPLGIEY